MSADIVQLCSRCGLWKQHHPDHTHEGQPFWVDMKLTGSDEPPGKLVAWPCKKCKNPQTYERIVNEDHDDRAFVCRKCGFEWYEDGSDA